MRTLRNAFLGLSILLAASIQAQFFVNISGHHTPCDPSIASGYVYIESLPGTLPEIALDVPINSNCYYTITLEVTSDEFGFQVWSGCANSITAIVGDSALGLPPGVTVAIVQDFDCSGQTVDCQGTPNGNALPGTPCVTPMNGQGTWNANCQCIPNAVACTACITVAQASGGGMLTPFAANFSSCSTGGAAPYTFLWDFSNAASQTGASVTQSFPGPGQYLVCLTLSTSDGCTAAVCDSVYFDANGILGNPPNPPTDCLGITNGPNVAGSPCNTPMNGEGTWSANCECIPNTNLPCQAGFWVMQAYTNGDSTNTGVTTVEPIPFELWIWNLSSGGSGNYQFAWDFGDGNSSTEAYPTHVYAASGPYTICLTITDDAGCTSIYCEEVEVDQDGILGMGTGFDVRSVLTIRVIQELPTGINERASLEATKLWPNPVVEQFNLTLNSSRSGNLTLSIVDLNGREVRTSNVSIMAGTNQLPMDVSGLESGMYVLRLNNGSNSAAMRFVKH